MNYLEKLTNIDEYLKERGYSLDSFFGIGIGPWNISLYGEITEINPIKIGSSHKAMWDNEDRVFHKFIFNVSEIEVNLILSTQKS